MKKRFLLLVSFLILLSTIVGCGGKPKADVPIFIMTPDKSQTVDSAKLHTSLAAMMGESPTVNVDGSPLFSIDNLMVKIAAVEDAIFVVPVEQFQSFAKQGGLVILDDLFNANDYVDGVVEAPIGDSTKTVKTEKHLYGIPINNTKWLQESGYRGAPLYAFIHPRAEHIDLAKQVLKTIVQK